MYQKLVNKIIVLSAIMVLAGCSNTPPQPAADGGILSAAELQSKIQVTVTKLGPVEEQVDDATIVAAAEH